MREAGACEGGQEHAKGGRSMREGARQEHERERARKGGEPLR